MNPRLALYSDQISPLTDGLDRLWLRTLPTSGATVGYLPSAPDPERRWFRMREEHYGRYGLAVRYFGLEEEFEPSSLDELFGCDAIHLSGGNTFRFLYWLRERGLIEPLRRYVDNGGLLIGVSAGAILMTRDIQSSLLCGDVLYSGLSDFEGLSLMEFAVVPHYDGSPEMARGLLEFSLRFGGPVYGVPDGSGIFIDGEDLTFFGAVVR